MQEPLNREQPSGFDSRSKHGTENYLEYYLDDIGAPELSTITNFDKRIMADTPLNIQLVPLELPKKVPEEQEDSKGYERYIRIKYFQENNRLPATEREATIATLGLDKTIARASRSRSGLPGKALAGTHASVKGFHAKAANSYGVLSKIMNPTEALEVRPDIERLRTDQAALFVVADAFMAREFLNRNDWRTDHEARQKYWRGFMLFAAKFASNDVLEKAFIDVLEKERNNRDYWGEQLKIADARIGYLVVHEEEGAVDVTDSGGGISKRPSRTQIESTRELLPEEVKKELQTSLLRYREAEYRIDTQIQQGIPIHLAELRVLGSRAIRDEEGHIIGVEPKEERPSTESIVKHRKRRRSNPANSPWIRKQAGYDKRPDK